MGTIGTFDGFTTARLGIYAAQHGLNVTGNNISNLNTVGYTRQRIEQVSLKTGGNDMYRSIYDNHIGNGALVTNINQIRDPYLDIQFRTVNSKVGYTDTWLSGLNDIAQTLDEVGKGDATNKNDEGDGILYAQLQDLRDMLMQLHNDPNKANDTLVRQSAMTLCQLFNTYANELETVRSDMDTQFKTELSSVNELLTSIRDLNDSIRKAEIVGDNALELRDERNLKIDSLSEYMHIKVEYTMEDIGSGKQVEKLTISLGNANPDADVHTDETVLIDGIYGAQLLYPEKLKVEDPDNPGQMIEVDNTNYTLQVSNLVDSKNVLPKNHNEVNAGRPITLADNDLYGSFQAMRELLTEKGEFATQADVDADPNAASKRGIPYYQMSLDLLAKKFAEVYNELNQGHAVDENGNPITGAVSRDLPTIIVAADGTVAKLNANVSPPEYDEQAGWKMVDGYCVDGSGNYVGSHGTTCDITLNPIPADAADVDGQLDGLLDCGFIDAAEHARISALTGDDKAAAVKEQLTACLKEHGITPDTRETVVYDGPTELGGPLFSNSNDGDDTEGITAANISVSHSWSEGDVQVVPKFEVLFGGSIDHTTQNTNIDHMISKIEESLVYNPQDLDPDALSSKLFAGSFNDMFSNMSTVLGGDQRVFNTNLDTNYTRAVDLDTQRDNVSGVDLNDEAMNIMMYQKAYSAACRMMTAIDEALDRLINNTGLAGL